MGEDEPELGDDNDSAFEDDHPMPADDQYSLWTTEDGSEEKIIYNLHCAGNPEQYKNWLSAQSISDTTQHLVRIEKHNYS